jgi:hypothetical protein
MAPRNVRALLTGAREAFMDTRLTALEETEKPIDIGAELARLSVTIWILSLQRIRSARADHSGVAAALVPPQDIPCIAACPQAH